MPAHVAQRRGCISELERYTRSRVGENMVHIYCKNSNYYKTANFIDTVLKLNGLQSRLELGSLPPSNVGGRVISVTDGFMTQEIYAYDAAKLDIFNPEVSEERAEAGCRFLGHCAEIS